MENIKSSFFQTNNFASGVVQQYWHYVLLCCLILCSLIFRVFPAIDVVFNDDGRVFLLGVDPYFYLRQVETTLHNYPFLQKFDHATHFPNGIQSDATGLYTLILASICKLLYGEHATTNQIAALMAWVAPMLSCAIYFMVYRIGSLLKNRISGLLAVLVLLFYPGLFLARSLFGFPDHHVIEIFLCLWLVLGITSNFVSIATNTYNIRRGFISSIPLILFFTIWPGAPLYILLIAFIFYNYIVFFNPQESNYRNLGSYLLIFFGSAGVGLSMVTFLLPQLLTNAFGQYESLYGPMILGLGILLYGTHYIKQELLKRLSHKAMITILILTQIIGVFLIFTYTDLGHQVVERLTFRATNLQENQAINMVNLLDMVSIPGAFSLIFSLFYIVQVAHQKKEYLHYIPTLLMCGFFILMWFNTYDMGYMLMPLISLLCGCFFYDLIKMNILSMKWNKWRQAVLVSVSSLILLITLIKPLQFSSARYPFIYSTAQVNGSLIYTAAWHDAMRWMQTNTPPLTYPTDTILTQEKYQLGEGQYGVLTSWDYGNIVNQLGKRIPTWSRWPENKVEKALYSPALSDIPIGDHIKYIVVNNKMAAEFFMLKYNDIFGNINSCYSNRLLENELAALNAPFLTCYEESLVHSLYNGVEVNQEKFKLVWESNQQKTTGYYFDGQKLSLLSMNSEVFNIDSLKKLKPNEAIKINNGIYYNIYYGAEIKIYQVL